VRNFGDWPWIYTLRRVAIRMAKLENQLLMSCMVPNERYALSQHEVVSIEIELVSVVKHHGSDAGLLRQVGFGESDTRDIRDPAYDTPDFPESLGVSQAPVIERKLKLPVQERAHVDCGLSRDAHERTLPNDFPPQRARSVPERFRAEPAA